MCWRNGLRGFQINEFAKKRHSIFRDSMLNKWLCGSCKSLGVARFINFTEIITGEFDMRHWPVPKSVDWPQLGYYLLHNWRIDGTGQWCKFNHSTNWKLGLCFKNDSRSKGPSNAGTDYLGMSWQLLLMVTTICRLKSMRSWIEVQRFSIRITLVGGRPFLVGSRNLVEANLAPINII